MRRISLSLTILFFGAAALAIPRDASAKKIKDSGTYSVKCLESDSNIQGAATISITPANMWPPNHKLRDMTISMNLNNDSMTSDNYSFSIESITDDQVVNDDAGGHGCGAKTKKQGADWLPLNTEQNPFTVSGNLMSKTDTIANDPGSVQLRAERCARDGTRTYTLSVSCCDNRNSMTPICDPTPEVLRVTVPKSHP